MDNNNLDLNKIIKIGYWSLPVVLFFTQLLFTLNSLHQIRYEEVAESIRNVYWFSERLIYDGVSSNLGWYITMLSIYKLFGFQLFAAKFLKLFLFFVSIFLTSLMLKKWLGYRKAFIPLVAIGLSPSFLFLNTLNVQFGLDFLITPILIFIILNISLKKNITTLLLCFILGCILIFSTMAYPVFLFYFPALFFLLFYRLKKIKKLSFFFHITPLISGFFLPFLLSVLYIRNSNLLLYDPIRKAGMFRGAGDFNFSLQNFFKNTTVLATDLFITGKSYYFEVLASDFSHLFPVLSILATLYLIAIAFKNKVLRPIILIITVSLIFNFLSTGFILNVGIRRNTPLIFGFYIFFTIAFYQLFRINFKNKFKKNILIIFLIILPIHHILVLSLNYNYLTTKSQHQYSLYFTTQETPQKSVDFILSLSQKEELRLDCIKTKEDNYCRFNEIYPLIKAGCKWNNLNCKNVYGYSPEEKKYLPLSLDLWKNDYWEH